MAEFQRLPVTMDEDTEPSPIEAEVTSPDLVVGAEGDHEWSAEEVEARERLFARQSESEPGLGSRASSAALPAQSPSCQARMSTSGHVAYTLA